MEERWVLEGGSKGRYRCVNCKEVFRPPEEYPDLRYCPKCGDIAAASKQIIKTNSAMERAAVEITSKLGKVNTDRTLGASTISTNAALQAAGKKIAKLMKLDTPEEALGAIISDLADRGLGLSDKDKGPNGNQGFKPHLQIQIVNTLMTMVNQVETLQAAKTLDLSSLAEEDLYVLLRPVAIEMLRNDTNFLVECLQAAKMQIMTDDGTLLGAEGPILNMEPEYGGTAEVAEQFSGGDGAEGRRGVDEPETGRPETLSAD